MVCRFACEMNEMEEAVAPTDSRKRPDQRLMEDGLWDEANVEKVSWKLLIFFASKNGLKMYMFCHCTERTLLFMQDR